ncbi:hypothetical protein [Synechococcus sp. C9]|uniref:hypothetical protein n=1 Tax=Synechococcus sp. C9 TaxID=102119 RepID=UPI001FF4B8C7|nr:hypothetical protein [Synechococcus sp. C9]
MSAPTVFLEWLALGRDQFTEWAGWCSAELWTWGVGCLQKTEATPLRPIFRSAL